MKGYHMVLKKTSITLSKSAEHELSRNTFLPSRSERICQIIQRYAELMRAERPNVDDLLKDSYLGFVVGEWAEVYPIPAMRLHTVVHNVTLERQFDGDSVPEDVDQLIDQLKNLSPAQEVALIEAIETSRSQLT